MKPIQQLERPGWLWRFNSRLVMGVTGALCKSFLYGLNDTQVTGLDGFLKYMHERRINGRPRGLLTVSNHQSALDDPLIWGVMPLRWGFDPWNHRWSLGAHDICFKNQYSVLSTFFSLGQVLPTYRLKHSSRGGIFQPTMAQAVRLLSDSGHTVADDCAQLHENARPTYDENQFLAPAAGHHRSWVHVFPEGCIHQHRDMSLRYFKWGVSRLILESEPTPDIIPIFIDGTQRILPEDRQWPRWLPRAGKDVKIAFGSPLNVDGVFGALIKEWKALMGSQQHKVVDLQSGRAVEEIRIEVSRRLRDEVQKLRRELGYADDDKALELAETWAEDPKASSFRSPVDGGSVGKS